MSPYITLRLEPEPPVPLPCRPFANAWYSAGSLTVTSTTQSMFTSLNHSQHNEFCQGLEFVYTKTYFLKLAMCNLYTTEIHKYSFSPPTVNTRVQIVQQITIDYLWFTPCSVLWASRRSRSVRSTNSLSTNRILMATINDYIVYNHRSPKITLAH